MRVAGFGFRKLAGTDSLAAALALAGGQVDALATAENKSEGLKNLALQLGVPVIPVPLALLAAQERPGSPRVKALFGTGSVAEASALAAAGPGATLVVSRVTSPDGMAVVAIAKGPE